MIFKETLFFMSKSKEYMSRRKKEVVTNWVELRTYQVLSIVCSKKLSIYQLTYEPIHMKLQIKCILSQSNGDRKPESIDCQYVFPYNNLLYLGPGLVLY